MNNGKKEKYIFKNNKGVFFVDFFSLFYGKRKGRGGGVGEWKLRWKEKKIYSLLDQLVLVALRQSHNG